jgi:hypothetical protein
MPINASGAPLGGGGSLHDIMRHISADTKERKQVASELMASSIKLVETQLQNREWKAMAQAQDREKAALMEQLAHAKTILEQLGPALLLRGGQRDQVAPSFLGKRQREVATTTGGPAIDDTTSHGRNDTDLNLYRQERDRLVAEMDADAAAAARTATTTSSTSTSTTTNGNSVQQMRDLASVYLFGLERVGALQDLRQAPDAILPGNFVEQPVATAAAVAVVATSTNELKTATTAIPVAVATSIETKTTAAFAAASTEIKTTAVTDDPTK